MPHMLQSGLQPEFFDERPLMVKTAIAVDLPAQWAGDRLKVGPVHRERLAATLGVTGQNNLNRLYTELDRVFDRLVRMLAITSRESTLSPAKKGQRQKIETKVLAECTVLQEKGDALIDAVENLSEETIEALSNQMIMNRARGTRMKEDSFRMLLERQKDLHLALNQAISRMEMSPKKGRDLSYLKDAIYTLAHIYRDFTRKNPARSFDGPTITGKPGKGESGEFLGFVQTFMRALPKENPLPASVRLSYIVRQVVKDFKGESMAK